MLNFLERYQLIDLTHLLVSDTPTWSGRCGFGLQTTQDYAQGCKVQQLTMHAGIGTHIDAPAHFIAGAATIEEISLQQLIVPLHVVDVSEKANADYFVTPEDIIAYEKKYGRIRENTLLMAYTGWSRHWNDAKKYRSQDEHGTLHFPAFSKASAELLLTRQVAGIAIDTLSPDSTDTSFSVHHCLLGAGKYIVENVANGHLLPAIGAYVITLPIRVTKGTEAPIRMVGLTPFKTLSAER
jgi:kynurenine formamidase